MTSVQLFQWDDLAGTGNRIFKVTSVSAAIGLKDSRQELLMLGSTIMLVLNFGRTQEVSIIGKMIAIM